MNVLYFTQLGSQEMKSQRKLASQLVLWKNGGNERKMISKILRYKLIFCIGFCFYCSSLSIWYIKLQFRLFFVENRMLPEVVVRVLNDISKDFINRSFGQRKSSPRKLAKELSSNDVQHVSYQTIFNFMKEQGARPYKRRKVVQPSRNWRDNRLSFCNHFLNRLVHTKSWWMNSVIFTDEAVHIGWKNKSSEW